MFFIKRKKKKSQNQEEDKPSILLHKVSHPPSIQGLSLAIPQGVWVYISRKNELGAFTFCDLCFGFLKPTQGFIKNPLSGNDVSFLGHATTTYGRSLLEHLSYATTSITKNLLIKTAEQTLSKELLEKIPQKNIYHSKLDEDISSITLIEKEYLEISEANAILQNRRAALVRMDSIFYQKALLQGFKHSKLFLDSGKTIFWMNYETVNSSELNASKNNSIPTLSLDFSHESPPQYTN